MFKAFGKNRALPKSSNTLFGIYCAPLGRRVYTTGPTSRYISKQTLALVGLISVTGYGLYWLYYPHNNYPRSVSKPLRNALWQERKFQDIKTSIRFYIDAINECKRLQMNELSDDYTGIEIKMAEMYEKLNDIDKANEVYLSIVYRIVNALKDESITNQSIRDNLLKRDLSLVNKIATNQTSTQTDNTVINHQLDLIEFHLALVENEIYKRSPELQQSMVKNAKEVPFVDVNQKSSNTQIVSVEPEKLKQFSKLFTTFKEEYFVLRELYTDMFLSKNNIEQAVESKMVTIGWMVLANMSRGQILLSQANLGSLLYMKAENIEANIIRNKSQNGSIDVTNELEKNRQFLLNMATKYYETVIDNAGDGNPIRLEDKTIEMTTLEATGLSMHGLGVINLHQGNLMKAKHFLDEALHLSQEIGFRQLYEESLFELEKLQKQQ